MAADPLVILAMLALGLGAAGWLSHRLRLPPALGYLAVGAVLSPTVSQTPNFPIPANLLQPAAQVGVLFLLFAIGLDLDLKRLREILRKGALVLPLDILVPTLLITAAARLAGWDLLQAAILGLTLSLSSTLFGERFAGAGGFPLDARQRTLGILLAEDLAAVALLAVFAILGTPGHAGTQWVAPLYAVAKLVFLFVLVTTAALLVVPRVLDAVARTHSHELMVLVGAAAVLGFGWLGFAAGSAELGALVAGVAAAEAGSRFVVRNGLQTVRDLALALFFFVSGLSTNLGDVASHPVLVLSVAALFLVAKVMVHVPAGLVAGLSAEGAVRSALALGTVGEFNLILVGAAQIHGLAHGLLGTAVVGAMFVLLVAVPILLRAVPRIVAALNHLPDRFRKPLRWLVQSLRASRTGRLDPGRGRSGAILAANLILLAGWAVLATALDPVAIRQLPRFPHAAPFLVYSVSFAVALPLVWGTYRSYRNLVRLLVGLEASQSNASARAKARLIDTAVAVTIAILLIPLTLLVPVASPVLLAGLLVAVVLAAVAWRQLGGFHRALEATVTRVLGQDADASAILDKVMEQYPFGVRFSAVALPPGSPVAGQTIAKARVEELTGATIAVLQRRGHEIVNPAPSEPLYVGDTVVLMGDTHQLERAEALLVAHGDALRLTAQSRLATVVEVVVHAGSALVGQSLGEADMQNRTGTLVVGVWPQAGRHPAPFRPDVILREGDRLIVLGSSLQVERARLLAEGEEQTSVIEAADEPTSPAA
ncbi:MAG: cation:proton antiporter [bacterium]